MIRRHRQIILVCAFLLACGSPKTTTNSCEIDSDCPSGEQCSPAGHCICPADGSTCSDDAGAADANGQVTLLSIAISPSDPSVALGATQQLTATGTFSDGSTGNITDQVQWTSSATAVASVSMGGLVTGVAEGTSTVSAELDGVTASTTVTVGMKAFTSITIAPNNQNVPAGAMLQLMATGVFSDGSMSDITSSVTWASSNVTVATVSSTGSLQGVSPGPVTITATQGVIQGMATFTVVQPIIASIDVEPATSTIILGTSQQLTAKATLTDGTMQDVTAVATWAVDNMTAAAVSPVGLVQSLEPGVVHATATYMSVTGTATVTIQAPTLQTITVAPVNPSLAAGLTKQMTATGKFSDGSVMDVTAMATWAVANTNFATVDASGIVTAVAAGTTSVTATILTVSGSTNVTVQPAQLASIAITPANSMLPIDETQPMTATGTFTDNTMHDLTTTATWVSSMPSVASITAAGVTKGLVAGNVMISATAMGITGTTQLTVISAALQSIAISPINATVPMGATQQMTVTGSFSDGTMHDVTGMATWMITNQTSATISSSGLVQTMEQGVCTITAQVGSFTAMTTLTVGPVGLVSIAVTPSGNSIPQGGTLQMDAKGTYSDGTMMDLTSMVIWVAPSNGVATVSLTGLVTGHIVGQCSISAALNGITGSAALTVTPAQLTQISVTPQSPSIPLGGSLPLMATGTFTDGSMRDITASCRWTSSAPAIATVSSGGAVFTVSAGSATITATSGSLSGSTQISVAALMSITVNPNGMSIPNGTTQQFAAIGTFTDGSMLDISSSVTWSSGDATIALINANGLATGRMQGMVQITATDGSIAGSATLTVGPPELVSIALGPTANGSPLACTVEYADLDLTLAAQMTAIGTFTDGSTSDITTMVAWSTSDMTLATVDGNGLVQTVGPGIVNVIASAMGVNSMEVSASMPLQIEPPEDIEITGAEQAIPAGTQGTLVATATFQDGLVRFVSMVATWTTSEPSVIAITPEPTACPLGCGIVAAVGPSGTSSTITATIGGIMGAANVTVGDPNLLSLDVEPTNQTLLNGDQLQLHATGTFSDGSMQQIDQQVTWTSSAQSIADVDGFGLVTADQNNTGWVAITAQQGSVSAISNINVVAGP